MLAAVVALFGIPVQAADLFDTFDGNGNIDWIQGPDDSGEFEFNVESVVDQESVARATNIDNQPQWQRAPYAYFVLDQATVDAGYIITARGRGISAAGTGSRGRTGARRRRCRGAPSPE